MFEAIIRALAWLPRVHVGVTRAVDAARILAKVARLAAITCIRRRDANSLVAMQVRAAIELTGLTERRRFAAHAGRRRAACGDAQEIALTRGCAIVA